MRMRAHPHFFGVRLVGLVRRRVDVAHQRPELIRTHLGGGDTLGMHGGGQLDGADSGTIRARLTRNPDNDLVTYHYVR